MYTGDDFNYDDLILGDELGHCDALLGIFDYIFFSERLRQAHFTEDDELTCRWHHGALTLDVLPLSIGMRVHRTCRFLS
jgi:hypothetical protein